MNYFYPLGITMRSDGVILAHVFLSLFLSPFIVPMHQIDAEFVRRYTPKDYARGTLANKIARELRDECYLKGNISQQITGWLCSLDKDFWSKFVVTMSRVTENLTAHDLNNLIMQVNFIIKDHLLENKTSADCIKIWHREGENDIIKHLDPKVIMEKGAFIIRKSIVKPLNKYFNI